MIDALESWILMPFMPFAWMTFALISIVSVLPEGYPRFHVMAHHVPAERSVYRVADHEAVPVAVQQVSFDHGQPFADPHPFLVIVHDRVALDGDTVPEYVHPRVVSGNNVAGKEDLRIPGLERAFIAVKIGVP